MLARMPTPRHNERMAYVCSLGVSVPHVVLAVICCISIQLIAIMTMDKTIMAYMKM